LEALKTHISTYGDDSKFSIEDAAAEQVSSDLFSSKDKSTTHNIPEHSTSSSSSSGQEENNVKGTPGEL